MSHASPKISENIDAYLKEHEQKDLLRFITCGSVDDGKSTLIGRLLHDSKMIYEDQLAAITQASKTSGTTGDKVDLALLVDGLQSEREQGITIDVAYRFFSTDKRKFIIADTPGHEQYTRNMATGASTASLAIILIDARYGIQTQTRRHSYICSLLGIRHLIVAVNKMDLVDYSQDRFDEIVADYKEFSKNLNDDINMHFVPISALEGDNVVNDSDNMRWYAQGGGEPLLKLLERIDVKHDSNLEDLRFPVQYVNRPNLDFRGYCGTLAAGILRPGDAIRVLGSGRISSVESLVTYDGELEAAYPGQAITVTLADEIDISRGDMLVAADSKLEPTTAFTADIVWMHDTPLEVGREYELKAGTSVVSGRVARIIHQTDVNTLERHPAREIPLNGIARCQLEVKQPLALDPYKRSPHSGSFIIIDRMTNVTVGAGMVVDTLSASNIVWHDMAVTKQRRAERNHQKPCIIWFTGLSGAGKSTSANALERQLFGMGYSTYLLDGDNVRHGLCGDLGFSDEHRQENIRRVGEVAKLMVDAGMITLVSFISPFQRDRDLVRNMVDSDEFIEVFVNTSLAVCEERDPKGLYQKARAGKIADFTGISSPYEAPLNPEIEINTGELSVEDTVKELVLKLRQYSVIV